MSGNSRFAVSSVTITSFRSPSISGRAIEAEIGVIQCTQYDESRGESTGTGISRRVRPRARA